MELKGLLIESLEQDTRDLSNIYVYRFKSKVDYKVFKQIQATFKDLKVYYSGFKKGFISKEKLNLENIKVSDSDIVIKNKNNNKITYHKTLLEYITIEELKEYLKEYAAANYDKYYMWSRYENATVYYNELCEDIDRRFKKGVDSYYNELSYIRSAIVWKSLNLNKDSFRANGSELYYMAIWEKLPIIEDLKTTDKHYTAIWGYDQTNVNIATLLNKRFNGLNVLVDTGQKRVYFTRLKDNSFNDGVRYFNEDKNWQETFKMDASVTGQYR